MPTTHRSTPQRAAEKQPDVKRSTKADLAPVESPKSAHRSEPRSKEKKEGGKK